MPTHYDTLGLSPQASSEEIRKAYKRLAVKYHPDKNLDDRLAEERFKRVNAAYQVLSDPRLKAHYDQQLEYQAAQERHRRAAAHRPPPPRPRPTSQTSPGRNPFAGPTQRRSFTEGEERKSTYMAFAFVAIMAVVVVIVVQVNKVVVERTQARKAAQQAYFLEQMDLFCKAGEIDSAMYIIQRMQDEGLVSATHQASLQFVLGRIYQLAEESYARKDYASTLFYGNIIDARRADRPSRELNYWIADSYSALGDTLHALQQFDSLIAYYPYEALPYLSAARLVIKDRPEDGLAYYKTLNEILLEGYEAKYGKAYLLVMPPEKVPGYHFEIYLEIGRAFLDQGKPEEALSYLRWATHLKRRNPEGYRWLVATYQALGDYESACFMVRQAIRNRYLPRDTALTQVCN